MKTEAVERERVEPVKGVAAVKAAPLIVLTCRAAAETVVALMKVVEKVDAMRSAEVCVVPTIFRLFTGWMLRLDVASPVIVPTVKGVYVY